MAKEISLYDLFKENTFKLLKPMSLTSQLNLLLSLDCTITIIDYTCLFPIKHNYYTTNKNISVYLVYNLKESLEETLLESDFNILLVDNILLNELTDILEHFSESCLINFLEKNDL